MKLITRRDLLTTSTAILGTSLLTSHATAAMLTPRASEGPFYPNPSMRLADVDNGLVIVSGLVNEAGGDILHLNGKVISKDGKPLAGHRVEIWQCDVNGRYLHPRDRRNIPYDNGFQGFGHDITDAVGIYRFRTIKPAKYPGRAPHIHVKVNDGERELLTTQFYIAGHIENNADFLYRRMSADQAQSVSMVLNAVNNVLETTVNLII